MSEPRRTVRSSRGVAGAALAALCIAAPPALAHEGNPNYKSEVRAVAQALEGLEAQVLNNDDRIQVVYDGDETLVVEGYRDEPYLRFSPGGRVEVNRRSPAAYLNEDRFAKVALPAQADHEAAPQWRTVANTGRYDWHDHRIHWMSKTTMPPQVEDEGERTKVFDWDISMTVAGRPLEVRGTLTWLGTDKGGFPLGAVLSLGFALLAGTAAVVVVRRRRVRAGSVPAKEAW
jgi:hypothetical protein